MTLLATISILLLLLLPSACARSDGSFGIYLADSGEQVISLEHIKAYHSLDYSLELTPKGIEKWNSFQTSTTIPKLAQSLYQRDFILKINGTEVCRGKFYSLVSSSTYDGIVIMDSIMKLDSTHTAIKLDFGYPPGFSLSTTPSDEGRITSELEQYFSGKHLLVADKGWWFPS
ncbi:MAG: hypothetical protein C4542_02835 [Dehalococcoidia bacterium]|nr:MAG: hypothetical protein C4542_02835 [Dehalococcoidia bacterium]